MTDITQAIYGPAGEVVKLLTFNPAPAKATITSDICTEFKFKANSPRGKFLMELHRNFGKKVPMDDLASAAFGANTTANFNKLGCLVGGLRWRIKLSGLAYRVVIETGTIALYPIVAPFSFN